MSKVCISFAAVLLLSCGLTNALAGRDLNCKAPCTKAQCAIQKCDLSVPYACVGGPASGGCSSTPSHFSHTSQCTACCDIASCAISCGPCGATECAKNPCPLKDPYVCTSGKDEGGCGPSNSTWSNNPGCKACCDTANCPTVAPTPAPTINCNVSCGSMCHSEKRCPFAAPFMCTAGAEANGCAAKDVWNTPGCTACCNVKLCPDVPCGTCSTAVCQSTQCSATNPYICTGGVLNGGCSPSSNYWPQNPDCTSCCDYSTCPAGSGSSN